MASMYGHLLHIFRRILGKGPKYRPPGTKPDGYLNLVWLDHGIGGEGKAWAKSVRLAAARIEQALDTKLSNHESSYYGSPLWRSGPTDLISNAIIHPNTDDVEEEKFWADYPEDALLMEIGFCGDPHVLRERLSSLGDVMLDYPEKSPRHTN